MNVNFFVPANHAAISGGNIYNELLVGALRNLGHNVNLMPVYDLQQWEKNLQKTGNQLVLADSLVLCKLGSELQPEFYSRIIPFIHMPPELMDGCHVMFSEKQMNYGYWSGFRHMFVTSAYTKSYYLQKGIKEDFITVVEPSPSLVFKKKKYRKKPFSLINVANVIPGKNQLKLIEIMSGLSEFDWTLTIAGDLKCDIKYALKVETAIKQNRLQSRIILAGATDNQTLEGIYSHADLLISTSVFETFGMNVYDAVCNGLPVVALEGGGITHALEKGPACVCISEDEMERTLRKLFVNENEYQNLISKGQQNPPEPVSWEQKADVLMKKIEELI